MTCCVQLKVDTGHEEQGDVQELHAVQDSERDSLPESVQQLLTSYSALF